MDTKTIEIIMKFMQRVNLSGAEVPAYNHALNELQKESLKLSESKDDDHVGVE